MEGVVFRGVIQVVPSLQWVRVRTPTYDPGGINPGDIEDHLLPKLTPPAISRSYDPLTEETALFMEFANLGLCPVGEEVGDHFLCKPDVILKFASKYGLMDSPRLSVWQSRINEMRSSVQRWQNNAAVSRSYDTLPEGLAIVPVLPFAIESQSVSIYCVPDHDPQQLQIISGDLWAILRLQFNLAVINQWQLRACSQCKKLFTVAPPITRKTRTYCSDACSQAAYRERRKQRHTEATNRAKTTQGTRRGRSKKDK